MRLWLGSPRPLGATWDGAGINFAVFSEHATRLELCLFDDTQATAERERLPLVGRTDHVWHGYLPGAAPGLVYGYRAYGPWAPDEGHRFNPAKVLLDPYAIAIARPARPHPSLLPAAPDGDGPPDAVDSAAMAPLAMVVDRDFDWAADRRPQTPWHETVIYELHVKGFSALNAGVPPRLRGTYLGLAADASIRHLKSLGVTCVELMPIHTHADERRLVQSGRVNYWGYNTIGYFAPDPRFAHATTPDAVVREFKAMVAALHEADLEVLLDVVYNHTAEGDHRGPTYSMRGLDNRNYYRLDPARRSRYEDFTGCGNTLDMEQPVVLQLMMDSLRYWVEEMHVDGFRFDLAAALARDWNAATRLGEVFEVIAQDPVLSRVKLIAEPWDVRVGGYQVGNFPVGWSEWNGTYRDAVRRFWRGDAGLVPQLATRLSGSSDLYRASGRPPQASINFVTCHDGFTLADLVSYDRKHNDANGEQNADGEDNNLSSNHGVEGPTTDAAIVELRKRQQRNFFTTLFVSLGVPMISGGDEVGRTQLGNNNGYCDDSPLTWSPWACDAIDADLFAFVRRLMALRAGAPVLRRRSFLKGRAASPPDVLWLTPEGREFTASDWNDRERRTLGMWLNGEAIDEPDVHGDPISGDTLLVLFNAGAAEIPWVLPEDRSRGWTVLVDTAHPAVDAQPLAAGAGYSLAPRSVAVLKAAAPNGS